MSVLQFLGSTNGRVLRAVAGAILAAVGILLGGLWWILAAVGLVVLAAGVFDFCLIAPLAGKPLGGRQFRDSYVK